MSLRLVAIDEGPDIALDRPLVVVGRHPACDTRLESLRVSRRHCSIAREVGGAVVRDLGSTNGIRINGMRVDVCRIAPKDELSIAHLRYRLEDDADQREPAPWPAIGDPITQQVVRFYYRWPGPPPPQP